MCRQHVCAAERTAYAAAGQNLAMTEPPNESALVKRLQSYVEMSDADRAVLQQICEKARPVASRVDIELEGEKPRGVHVLLSGIACRYKMLSGGRRRIITFLLPGELCDVHVNIVRVMDHNIMTLSPCDIATVPNAIVKQIADEHPNIMRGLACADYVFESILREQIANVGGRDAVPRLGHMLCELYHRFASINLVHECAFDLPITQIDLGDALGITPVHTNRSLQALRRAKVVKFDNRRVRILDLQRLAELSDFRPDYLHLTQQPKSP